MLIEPELGLAVQPKWMLF